MFPCQPACRVQPDYLERVRQADFSTTTTLLAEEHTDTTTEAQKNAAIDVGANNTLTVITEDSDCCVFHARPQFREFQQGHREIADLQSALPDETYSSRRIHNLYDSMYDFRDHHRDAAVKHAAQWLLEHGVTRVYVGDVADVLSTH